MMYVVRHGKTDWNDKKITMGRKDVPLNKKGINEAENLRELLKDYSFDLIICSPLTRTKETADIINENRNSKIIYDDRIMERYLGELEGQPYTNDNDRLWDISINTSDYGIETMEEFKDRVYSFMDELSNNPNEDILLVTHGGVSALINCYFNNKEYNGFISNMFLKNGDVARYEK